MQDRSPTGSWFCFDDTSVEPSRLFTMLLHSCLLSAQDRSPAGNWFCFDDTSVEPWDPAKLDKDCFGGRFI